MHRQQWRGSCWGWRAVGPCKAERRRRGGEGRDGHAYPPWTKPTQRRLTSRICVSLGSSVAVGGALLPFCVEGGVSLWGLENDGPRDLEPSMAAMAFRRRPLDESLVYKLKT